eukprot:2077163-Prymnesium_polylepis.1
MVDWSERSAANMDMARASRVPDRPESRLMSAGACSVRCQPPPPRGASMAPRRRRACSAR